MDIRAELCDFLTTVLGISPSEGEWNPDAPLVDEYGVDSAGIFELILWVEDHFGIAVPQEDMELANFASLYTAERYIQKKVTRGASAKAHDSQPMAIEGRLNDGVSVVMLACGAPDITLACLESIMASRHPELQLVVVNNGGGESVAGALRVFAEHSSYRLADLQIITNATNFGACSGRNQGLTEVNGEYVAFLDNDIICRDPLWLERLIGVLQSDSLAGIVGPRIVCNDGPYRVECAGYAVDPGGQVIPLGAGAAVDDPRWRCRQPVQAVGNFLARTSVIRQIDGFDTAFDPFGFENTDCCYRVKQLGLSIVCDGRTDLHHVGHVTTGEFEDGGRRVLFEKSLLFRKRWAAIFKQEKPFFEKLNAMTLSADDEGAVA